VAGSESLWLNAAGWSRRYRSPIRLLGASRELVEWQARARVTALDNVRVLQGHEVVGLLADGRREAVTGVRLRSRGDRAGVAGPAVDVAAELVVDASGRGSRAPQWLAALGYPPPTETCISSLLGYASRQYRIPPGFRADWRMLLINAKPPGNARTGALVPIEGGRWMVALIGAGRDHPPTDDAGFLEFARRLRSPLLYETIREAEPVSPIFGFRNTDNRRRHFERLRRWPERFVVIGDASCTFNPIYAQGMTVTAMTAVALDRHLAGKRRRSGAGPAGRARRFQRQVAKASAGAWTMATTEDLRYPWTEGARPDLPTRVMHRYADRVLEVANGNPQVNTAFVDVVNLRRPPTSLLRPGVLLPVLARRRAPALTDPPTTVFEDHRW
jgi:2-polyprenyl-6-methoxyphenol hydroxylase-like FAD-dependent oxidoreductase